MMMTRYNPWRMSPWHRDFDRLLGELQHNGHSSDFNPAVDIKEEEERYLIEADLPGLEEKDIEVKVHDGTLVLSGKRETVTEEKKENSSYSERRFGSFCRTFRLGRNVDPEGIEASYKSGVLTVSLPKREETKPRQIPIATN